MKNHEEQLAAIQEMRDLMDQASQFKSISGLSGILAGFLSLICIYVTYLLTGISLLDSEALERIWHSQDQVWVISLFGLLVGACVSIGIFMAVRKARNVDRPIWDHAAKRLLFSLAIPVLVGGFFSLLLLRLGLVSLLAPVTLLFYGMGLLNSSKYTLRAVQTVGFLFILLGLLATACLEYGLLIWTMGFGLVHIVYGFIIYIRYERA
jgi:hypothetical protein